MLVGGEIEVLSVYTLQVDKEALFAATVFSGFVSRKWSVKYRFSLIPKIMYLMSSVYNHTNLQQDRNNFKKDVLGTDSASTLRHLKLLSRSNAGGPQSSKRGLPIVFEIKASMCAVTLKYWTLLIRNCESGEAQVPFSSVKLHFNVEQSTKTCLTHCDVCLRIFVPLLQTWQTRPASSKMQQDPI
jgi:hypothetical protein